MARIDTRNAQRECIDCKRTLSAVLHYFGKSMICIRCATAKAEASTLSPQERIDREFALSRKRAQAGALRILKNDHEPFLSGYFEV